MLSDSVQTAAHMLKNEAQRGHKTTQSHTAKWQAVVGQNAAR